MYKIATSDVPRLPYGDRMSNQELLASAKKLVIVLGRELHCNDFEDSPIVPSYTTYKNRIGKVRRINELIKTDRILQANGVVPVSGQGLEPKTKAKFQAAVRELGRPFLPCDVNRFKDLPDFSYYARAQIDIDELNRLIGTSSLIAASPPPEPSDLAKERRAAFRKAYQCGLRFSDDNKNQLRAIVLKTERRLSKDILEWRGQAGARQYEDFQLASNLARRINGFLKLNWFIGADIVLRDNIYADIKFGKILSDLIQQQALAKFDRLNGKDFGKNGLPRKEDIFYSVKAMNPSNDVLPSILDVDLLNILAGVDRMLFEQIEADLCAQ